MLSWLLERLDPFRGAPPAHRAKLRRAIYHASVTHGASGVRRFALAGRELYLEDMIARTCERASALFLSGEEETVEAARQIALQEYAVIVRQEHGHEVATEFRRRMTELPVVLLLNEAALAKLQVSVRPGWR